MKKNFRRRSGFTLVELLVVVAIIGVLVAILVPTVHRVRSQAQIASCKNLLKGIETALSAYQSDEGRYPPDPYDNWDGPPDDDVVYVPPGQPSFIWLLLNGKDVYFNTEDEHLTGNPPDRKNDKAIGAKDPWGNVILYVAAPHKRSNPNYFNFPGGSVGGYNLWSVGLDGKCDSCNDKPGGYKGNHADGTSSTSHLGGDGDPQDDVR